MADEELVVLPSIDVPSSDSKRKHEGLDVSDENPVTASTEVEEVISIDEGTVTKRMKFDSNEEANGNADDISEDEHRPKEDKKFGSEINEAGSEDKDFDSNRNGPGSFDNSGGNTMGSKDNSGVSEEAKEIRAVKNELSNEHGSGIDEVANVDNSEIIEFGNEDKPDINDIEKDKPDLKFHKNHPEDPICDVLPKNSISNEVKDTNQCSIQEPVNVSEEENLEEVETVVLSRDSTKSSSLEHDVQIEIEKSTSYNVVVPNEEVQSLDDKKACSLENEVQMDHDIVATSNLEISNDEDHSLDITKISSLEDEIPTDDDTVTSRKIEIPNDKVGVLIGKGGDTIRFIQSNADAKIQIMRDAEADLHSVNRPVEIVGKLSCIVKAKKLIDAVIAEANAGGSPSLVARGISGGQSTGQGEQVEMQVPNDKVGLIIGRRGENIKSLQARSGARIQLIPQHQPEGDGSKNRIVRLSGDRRQVKTATDMILDVMNQQMRGSSGPYNHPPPYGPSGPGAPHYWGQQGPHHQPMHYDYPPRPSHYGNFSMPQMAPRMPSWEQRPFSHTATFDSYNARGHPPPGHYMGPPNQGPYYPQSHPSEYSHQTPYPSHTYPPNQPYPTQQYSKQPYQQPYGPLRQDNAYPSQQYSYPQSYLQPTSSDVYNQASAYPQNTTTAGYVQPAASAYTQGGTASYGQYMYGEQGGYQVNQDGSYSTITGMVYAQPASAQAASQSAVYDHTVAQQSVGAASVPSQAQTGYGYDSGQTFAAPH